MSHLEDSPMSIEDADGPLAGSRPALANSQTTPSRSRIGLQTILALVVGCGVLWWIVHTVSSNKHGTNGAIRAMRSRDASERISGIKQLETAGLGNGQTAIPALIVALGDSEAASPVGGGHGPGVHRARCRRPAPRTTCFVAR